MLTELRVANFAIIDRVNIVFRPGFNVLSGETGSGKSVLLKSLALLMGEKSVSDAIKTGATSATVEGLFDIAKRPDIKSRLVTTGISDANQDSDVDDLLVVKRIIANDGKSRVYINGSLSTLQQLREIVAPLIELTGRPTPLIEMTGQHENRNLQSKSFHLENLDEAIGTLPLRQTFNKLYQEHLRITTDLANLKNLANAREQRLDFLTFQRDEIRSVELNAQDDDSLAAKLQLQKDSKRLLEFIAAGESALYSDDESALVRLHRVIQQGQIFANIDATLAQNLEVLTQAKTLIEDAVYQLREYGQKFSQDPAILDDLEKRVSQIRKLQKKYGGTTESVLQALEQIESEISQLERSDDEIKRLEKLTSQKELELKRLAADLHAKRRKGAAIFAKNVNAELADLNMKGLLFSIQVNALDEFTPSGSSDVEFQIQNSKDDEPRALAKFASGGELSRILLALKRAVAQSHVRSAANHTSALPQTFIFDEVDAGISGVTAEKVGRKLAEIAAGQQIICVTHLPQVAAFAQTHFVIQKIVDDSQDKSAYSELRGSTKPSGVRMSVDELSHEKRVREIARMLSGEKITKSSLANAADLLRLVPRH